MNSEYPRTLNLFQRLNISIDITCALHYLHYEIKPNNVLFDDDMVAHVIDFGITRLVSAIDSTSYKETSTTRKLNIIGTIFLDGEIN